MSDIEKPENPLAKSHNEIEGKDCPHEFDLVDASQFLFRCCKCKTEISPGINALLRLRDRHLNAGRQWPIVMNGPFDEIVIWCQKCTAKANLIPKTLPDLVSVSAWWKKCKTECFEILPTGHFKCKNCGHIVKLPIFSAISPGVLPKKHVDNKEHKTGQLLPDNNNP